MNKYFTYIILPLMVASAAISGALLFQPKTAHAAEGEFFLEVSPSPLVTTLKPGESQTLDFKVRNAGPKTENLKIELRSFKVNNTTGEVKFNDTRPAEVADWIKFKAETFSIDPGQWYNQQLTINVPKNAGFSYSFAMLVTRNDAASAESGRSIKAQIGVFVLLNIDRPGATRKLEIEEITADKDIYEYLPATINIRLKNTGNAITQPTGDVFIQRGANDTTPIDNLAVNKSGGYILPGTVRTLSVQWDNGFLVNRTTTDDNGTSSQKLDWNWSNLSHLRMGHYTAKVVAIYNDGQRDIPITGEVGFWVIPWKIIGVFLIIAVLLIAGIWSFVSKVYKLSRPNHNSKTKRTRL